MPTNSRIRSMACLGGSSRRSRLLRHMLVNGLAVISTCEISNVVQLENIKAQTTLVNGQNDTIIDLEDIEFLASQIPNCETKIIENVGHFLHLEREEVLDIYQEILLDNQ